MFIYIAVFWSRFRALCEPQLAAPFSNLVALGIPRAVSEAYMEPFRGPLAALGVSLSPARGRNTFVGHMNLHGSRYHSYELRIKMRYR